MPSLTPPSGRAGWHRFAVMLAALAGIPLGLVLVATGLFVAIALSGTTIDLSRWRDVIAQRLSSTLGRTVILEGDLAVEPSLGREIGVRLGGLRILDPPGHEGGYLLTIGALHARVDLPDALRGRLRSSGIEARGVSLKLERRADGVGNWTASRHDDAGEQPRAVDIGRIVLHSLGIQYHDARSGTRRLVAVHELSGSIGQDRPLQLTAHGHTAAGLAYSFRVEGGPLGPWQGDAGEWPVGIEFRTEGAHVQARGGIDARRHAVRLQVDARAVGSAPLEGLVGSALPDLGHVSVQCLVAVDPNAFQVSGLRARLGESDLSGALRLDFGGERPRLAGSLSAGALDLGPFLATQPNPGSPRAEPYPPVMRALRLRDLAALDVDVELKVDRWLGLGADIRESSVAWRGDGRDVRVPISARIAGVPVDGALELDASTPMPSLILRLGAEHVALRGPGQSLLPGGEVNAVVGRVRLRADARGDTLASLARDLGLSLELAGMQVRPASGTGATPSPVSIDTLRLAARPGERLRGHARGSLLGERGTLTIRGGTLNRMLHERILPLELDLAFAQARMRAEGTLSLAPSRDTAIRFDFQSRRAGDLARWVSVAPQADLPVSLRGRLRVSGRAWMLDDTTLELGRSHVTIAARGTPGAERTRIAASVRGTGLDARELSTLHAGRAMGRDGTRDGAPTPLGMIGPLDADIDIHLQRLSLGRTDVEDLAFAARVRDGRVLPLSITGRIAAAPFAAIVDMDAQARPPSASLALTAGAIDVGTLLRGLGVAEVLDGHARALEVTARTQGSSLDEWVAQSGFDMRVSGGTLAVLGAARGTIAELRVDEAHIGARPGEPVRARIDGTIGPTPIGIDVSTGTLADLARDASHLPFTLVARAAGTQLALDGQVSLPLGTDGQLDLSMHGERLDSLSSLAGVELPAWGPWSLRTPIRMTANGYALPSLQASVGGSRLGGTAVLDLGTPRPSLDLAVDAPSIQLDDFPLSDRAADPAARSDDRSVLRQAATQVARHTDTLLSAAFLRRLDARIDVTAKEILSGDDRLADGAARVRLVEGRLRLDPVTVNVPGGAVRLSVSYEPKETEVALAVAAHVERLDYGIVARRLDRTDDLRGLFSLDLALAGTAPTLETIMRNASGRVDFAVWPTDLRSGVFQLWSVNLLLQLLPLIDPDTRPKVNCIVGRFDLEHGDLSDDRILIDTSAVRVRGAGHASLATEELEFVFRPRAKGFALFRLQTPLRVSGKLDDRRFGFGRMDVAASALRMIASPILLPIDRLVLGPLPRDGADVCAAPLRAESTAMRMP